MTATRRRRLNAYGFVESLPVKDRILAEFKRVLFPYFAGVFVIPGKPGQSGCTSFLSSSSQAEKETPMRIDDLNFEYEPDVYAYISDFSGIDLVVQPLRKGFAAEVIDGAEVHRLGEFPSERWAKVAALNAAMEISALTR